MYRLLYNKYYVDQIYDAMFVNRTKDLATTLGAFDRGVINGLGVDGAGWLTRADLAVSMVWDTWIVDGLVNLAARIVWVLSYPVRMLQSGRVGNYALLIVVGVLVGLGYYLHAGRHHVAQRVALEGEDGMEFYNNHILSVILFTPLVGAILLLFVPRESENAHRVLGNLFALLGFVVSLPLVWKIQRRDSGLPVPRDPPTGFPRSARITRWESTASASCW